VDLIAINNMRTFKVLILDERKKKSKVLSLPCSGELPYNGCDALEVLRDYAKKKPLIKTCAHTETNGTEEQLTIEEMEDLFGEETDAREIWEKRIK